MMDQHRYTIVHTPTRFYMKLSCPTSTVALFETVPMFPKWRESLLSCPKTLVSAQMVDLAMTYRLSFQVNQRFQKRSDLIFK